MIDDLGPAWLRDYGHTDFGDIEADILAMEEFAARLRAEVERDYAPRALAVSDTMLAGLPAADPRFAELAMFLKAHEQAQDAALQNVYNFANGTYGFATAAKEVSERYSGADAYVRARVADVQAGFRRAGILPQGPASAAGPSQGPPPVGGPSHGPASTDGLSPGPASVGGPGDAGGLSQGPADG